MQRRVVRSSALCDAQPRALGYKFILKRKHGNEVRRVRGQFTFDEVGSFVNHWWRADGLVWQYVDCEGDVVTMNTAAEWEECQRLHHEAGVDVVKITISKFAKKKLCNNGNTEPRPKPQRAKEAQPAPQGSRAPSDTGLGEEQCTSEDTTPSTVPEGNDVPLEFVSAEVHMGEGRDTVRVAPEAEEAAREAAMALLELLFGTHALDLLTVGVLHSDLEHLVHIAVEGRDTKVDIDMTRLAHLGGQKGLKCLEQNDPVSACELYKHAHRLLPQNVILSYNYACALALCGKRELAMEQLAHAVRSGYCNVQHMLNDADLVSLHALPEFHQLMSSLRVPSLPVEQAAPQPIQPPPSPMAPAVRDPNAETLMVLFPGLDEESAKALLREVGGDVRRAVETILGS